jgi:hypothetical protein
MIGLLFGERMSALMPEILTGYAYQLIFNGTPGAGFADCDGLEGPAALGAVRQVSLYSGVLVTREFFDWVMQHSAPHGLRLVQLDADGREQRSWQLLAARVSKVTATTFTGKVFPFRVEALELALDGAALDESRLP